MRLSARPSSAVILSAVFPTASIATSTADAFASAFVPNSLARKLSTPRPFSTRRFVSHLHRTLHQSQPVDVRYLRMMSSSAASRDVMPGRVALLQFLVTESKSTNHATAMEYLSKAATAGAQLAVLPEIWNSPYATAAFGEYAELLPDVGAKLDDVTNESSPSAKLMMDGAKSNNLWIVGGSIPERVVSADGADRIYNTCLCIDPAGTIVGKHRKVHLFDIDVPGGIRFMESDTLSPGGTLTAFDAGEPFGTVGVGICYDIRFPEYALLLAKKYQCKVLIYPGAFNLTTGPAHWELLQRARAVDNQCYVLTAAPARSVDPASEEGGGTPGKYPHYSSWGHSTVVSPWGEVVATCAEEATVVVADLDMGKVKEMREGIPTSKQKRDDLYQLSG